MSKKVIPGLKNVVVTEAGRLETGGGLGIGSLDKLIELHPLYAGGLWWQEDYRGTDSGNHDSLTLAISEETVSNILYHYYETSSSEAYLNDKIISVLITIPDDFNAWRTNNAITVDFKTESGTSINCHVDVHIYKSGAAAEVASSTNNANTSWSYAGISSAALGPSWSAGDVMEIFLVLETRSNNYARVGKITVNYTT